MKDQRRRRSLSIGCKTVVGLAALTTCAALRESSFACPNVDAEGSSSSSSSAVEDGQEPFCPPAADVSAGAAAPLPIGDDETLLDLFGEAAKELLTRHLVPPTDQSCRWDWRTARCEPHCDCALLPLWGDYHLGRSCRVRYEYFDGRETCHLPPTTPYARIVHAMHLQQQRVAAMIGNAARKAGVKKRVLSVRDAMCFRWEERAQYKDGTMKRWQRRLCGIGPQYDTTDTTSSTGTTEYEEEEVSTSSPSGEQRPEETASEIAAKIASVIEGVGERSSAEDHRRKLSEKDGHVKKSDEDHNLNYNEKSDT